MHMCMYTKYVYVPHSIRQTCQKLTVYDAPYLPSRDQPPARNLCSETCTLTQTIHTQASTKKCVVPRKKQKTNQKRIQRQHPTDRRARGRTASTSPITHIRAHAHTCTPYPAAHTLTPARKKKLSPLPRCSPPPSANAPEGCSSSAASGACPWASSEPAASAAAAPLSTRAAPSPADPEVAAGVEVRRPPPRAAGAAWAGPDPCPGAEAAGADPGHPSLAMAAAAGFPRPLLGAAVGEGYLRPFLATAAGEGFPLHPCPATAAGEECLLRPSLATAAEEGSPLRRERCRRRRRPVREV